jgi:hypothetical protein
VVEQLPSETVTQLDANGRCCGRKPIFYKGGSYRSPLEAPLHFCAECCREFGPDGKHRQNWAWKKSPSGELVRIKP